MPFKKGQSGNPRGRPPGMLAQANQYTARERVELVERTGMSPLQFLLSVMIDPDEAKATRVEAAKAAAPYVHRKMPTMVEVAGQMGTMLDYAAVMALPSHDRQLFLTMLERMGVRVASPVAGVLPGPSPESLGDAERDD